MNSRIATCFVIAAGLVLTLAVAQLASAEVIYSHTFLNSSGPPEVDVPIDDAGTDWAMRYEKTATDSVVNPSGDIVNQQGVLSRLSGVGSAAGYLYCKVASDYCESDTEMVHYTTETLDRSIWNIDSFTWYMRNNDSGDNARLAIEIDSRWYASNNTFSQSGTWAQKTLTFSTSAGDWREMTFDTSDISVAGSTLGSALPSGNITDFGVYVQNSSGNDELTSRIDDFEVNATLIPEPSTLMLLGMAGLGLLLWRLRRKK